MSEPLTRRLAIRGRVQGVWFRESMRIEADRLGIAGWVRNRPDGSVEAVVHGASEGVAAIVAWARRGPEQAEVTAVDVAEAEGRFTGFEKRPTG